MAEEISLEVGNEYESNVNGNTYTVQRISNGKVQLSNYKTGASWHNIQKVKDDIKNGVLN